MSKNNILKMYTIQNNAGELIFKTNLANSNNFPYICLMIYTCAGEETLNKLINNSYTKDTAKMIFKALNSFLKQ